MAAAGKATNHQRMKIGLSEAAPSVENPSLPTELALPIPGNLERIRPMITAGIVGSDKSK